MGYLAYKKYIVIPSEAEGSKNTSADLTEIPPRASIGRDDTNSLTIDEKSNLSAEAEKLTPKDYNEDIKSLQSSADDF